MRVGGVGQSKTGGVSKVTPCLSFLRQPLPSLSKVIRTGFEPVTYCLEGSCSIQLSYRTRGRIKPQR